MIVGKVFAAYVFWNNIQRITYMDINFQVDQPSSTKYVTSTLRYMRFTTLPLVTYSVQRANYFRYTGTCPAHSPFLGNMRHLRRSGPVLDSHKPRYEDLRQCTPYTRYCCQNIQAKVFAIPIFILLSFLSYSTLVLSQLY